MIVSNRPVRGITTLKEFQFHYGMIVRKNLPPMANKILYFNSTMGWLWVAFFTREGMFYKISIPLWDDCECKGSSHLRTVLVYFNSTMGWLWVSISATDSSTDMYFNSTMGWLWVGSIVFYSSGFLKFQFHYGMIVRLIYAISRANRCGISIPLWDDCELEQEMQKGADKEFQFHYGMIVS